MHATVIPCTKGRIIPWGNGLGTSREIILELAPPQQALEQESPPLLWRLARTRHQADCPFSLYPAQDRIIVLLEGNGFELGPAESAIPEG